MSKKIGIITFQRAHNYGAILQCLALQEFLAENTEATVSVIDYKPDFLNYYHYFIRDRFSLNHPISTIKEIIYLYRRFKRFISFDNFIESYIKLNKEYSNNLSEYDLIIVGSDQLWNIKNTNNIFDKMYWGRFKDQDTPKLITYAVSTGGCSTLDWNKVKEYINQFDSISVREKYLKENLEKHANYKSQWVLDPTLLQNREFWIRQTVEYKPNRPYLFYYQARNKPLAFQYAKKLASKMNLDFIYISAHIMLPNSNEGVKANPIDFLNILRNATYVVTSSFHGTVFSVQFHKNFSTLLLNDGDDGRSISFLQSIGLENHLVSITEQINDMETDWNKVDEVLEQKRQESRMWLLKNI